MKPFYTIGALQTILGFISAHVFFHTVRACASELRERSEVLVYVAASFFGDICLGQTRLLVIKYCYQLIAVGRKNWFGFLGLQWEDFNVNLWIFSIAGMIDPPSIGSLRITSDIWNNVVIEVKKCSFTKIFWRVDDNLTQYKIFDGATYPIYGLFAMIGFIIMPIDQRIKTVGGNKLQDKARPEFHSQFIFPKNNVCQHYMFLHFSDDEIIDVNAAIH